MPSVAPRGCARRPRPPSRRRAGAGARAPSSRRLPDRLASARPMLRIDVLERRRDARSVPSETTMKTLAPNAALLVIDLQKGFDEPSWGRRNNPRMEARVADLLAALAREPTSGHPRPAHVHQPYLAAPARSTRERFQARGAPLPGEPVIEKRVNSCFIGTSLEADLSRVGLRHARHCRADDQSLRVDDGADGGEPRLRRLGGLRRDRHVRSRGTGWGRLSRGADPRHRALRPSRRVRHRRRHADGASPRCASSP